MPGLSQQQVQGIKVAMRASATTTLVDRLLAAPPAQIPPPSDRDVAEVSTAPWSARTEAVPVAVAEFQGVLAELARRLGTSLTQLLAVFDQLEPAEQYAFITDAYPRPAAALPRRGR